MNINKNTKQRYIISPHDNVENFVDNAIGMNEHKVKRYKVKGSGPEVPRKEIVPIFKDLNQQRRFHETIDLRRDKLIIEMKTLYEKGKHLEEVEALFNDRLKTLHALHDASNPATPKTQFSSSDEGKTKIYVQGHGKPGSDVIEAANTADLTQREPKTADDVASILKGMNVPQNSIIRANSCYSSARFNLNTSTNKTLIERDRNANLPNIIELAEGKSKNDFLKIDYSFSESLQQSLNKQKVKYDSVSGYPFPTNIEAQNVEDHTEGSPDQYSKRMSIEISRNSAGSDAIYLKKAGKASTVPNLGFADFEDDTPRLSLPSLQFQNKSAGKLFSEHSPKRSSSNIKSGGNALFKSNNQGRVDAIQSENEDGSFSFRGK